MLKSSRPYAGIIVHRVEALWKDCAKRTLESNAFEFAPQLRVSFDRMFDHGKLHAIETGFL
jgi:hypothetical protein